LRTIVGLPDMWEYYTDKKCNIENLTVCDYCLNVVIKGKKQAYCKVMNETDEKVIYSDPYVHFDPSVFISGYGKDLQEKLLWLLANYTYDTYESFFPWKCIRLLFCITNVLQTNGYEHYPREYIADILKINNNKSKLPYFGPLELMTYCKNYS
jgi:hypothetical protein